jgi:undecaprenyl-diphosphatase
MPLHARLLALDRRLSARLALPRRARLLHAAALVVAHTGDSLLWLSGAGAALLWGGPAWRDVGWRIVAANLVGGALTAALKLLVRRQRPAGEGGALYTRLDRHSFPSGHAVRGAAMVVLLAPLLAPWGQVLFPLWGGLVGLARVALGVHFTSDVVGGWGVGAAVGGVLLFCL